MELTEQNYYSNEMARAYCSVSQLKQFIGLRGEPACEYRALAEIDGAYTRPSTTALLLGQYVETKLLEPSMVAKFEEEHPELFSSRGTTKGQLKSDFKIADKMVERCKADPFFMKTLVGEHQKIMVGEIYGVPFKIKMDVYFDGRYITDLKTCQSIREGNYNPIARKYQSFVEYNDYITQATIYTEIVRQNTGKVLPFFLSCVSKQDEPDIEVIQIDYETQQDRLAELEDTIRNVQLLKNREIKPTRCGGCAWCRKNKVLKEPINWLELGGELN